MRELAHSDKPTGGASLPKREGREERWAGTKAQRSIGGRHYRKEVESAERGERRERVRVCMCVTRNRPP